MIRVLGLAAFAAAFATGYVSLDFAYEVGRGRSDINYAMLCMALTVGLSAFAGALISR